MNLVSKFTKFINITFANFCRTISFCHYLPEKKRLRFVGSFFFAAKISYLTPFVQPRRSRATLAVLFITSILFWLFH